MRSCADFLVPGAAEALADAGEGRWQMFVRIRGIEDVLGEDVFHAGVEVCLNDDDGRGLHGLVQRRWNGEAADLAAFVLYRNRSGGFGQLQQLHRQRVLEADGWRL